MFAHRRKLSEFLLLAKSVNNTYLHRIAVNNSRLVPFRLILNYCSRNGNSKSPIRTDQ